MSRGLMFSAKRFVGVERRVVIYAGGALATGILLFAAARVGFFTSLVTLAGFGGATRAEGPPKEEAQAPTEVRLSDEKVKTARLEEQEVVSRQLRETRTVPGTITYNDARRRSRKGSNWRSFQVPKLAWRATRC